eukprot:4467872-Pyramimonas_sp.AAC.1
MGFGAGMPFTASAAFRDGRLPMRHSTGTSKLLVIWNTNAVDHAAAKYSTKSHSCPRPATCSISSSTGHARNQ